MCAGDLGRGCPTWDVIRVHSHRWGRGGRGDTKLAVLGVLGQWVLALAEAPLPGALPSCPFSEAEPPPLSLPEAAAPEEMVACPLLHDPWLSPIPHVSTLSRFADGL